MRDRKDFIDDALAKVAELGTVGAMNWLAESLVKKSNSVDTVRLDFIDANPNLFLRCYKRRWQMGFLLNKEVEVFRTAREAIDAAILDTKESK